MNHKTESSKLSQSASLSKKAISIPMHRRFTVRGQNPLDRVVYVKAHSKIKDTEGQAVFEMKDVEVPASWSQLAIDILVSKYFRKAGVPGTGHETSIRQVIKRLAHTLRNAGEKMGYFNPVDADTFEAELSYLLVHQMGAFNSPVWFNLGLYAEYGIEGSGGNFAFDFESGTVKETPNAYERPQCSACFIQSVDDDLMSIFDLIKNEARLFKYGSGTGTNFSKIRGRQEKISGGGYSSGLMSFLEVLDRSAGATKSGGTTRRAAKMVSLDLDHPEILDFIQWKMKEERKVAALIAAGYSADFNGEAYKTVAGQNSNNSLRISDEFMDAVVNNRDWNTIARTDGSVVDTYKARDLWKQIAQASWSCADPGLQFDTVINDWHTCANTDKIRASNPCSEYMFLDDTACNLSSLNLVKFLKTDGSFDLDAYRDACRVLSVAQEILVDFSSYPTKQIAENSHRYRPLGLGYANLGTLLMLKGIPYDSDEGRAWAASLTAILCGEAYAVSAEVASKMGPFLGYANNRESMLKVMRKHKEAAYKIDANKSPTELFKAAKQAWDQAVLLGELHGYRNAQVTVLAPTGTIGLLMDCDTTGIEPDFALVKFKKLAGGGYFKMVNQSVEGALQNLKYSASEIKAILTYVLGTADEKISGTLTLEGAPHLKPEHLAVFDCANKCGPGGTRFIAPMGHIRMMAAVQPFLSGAISKTVNLPNETTVEEIEQIHLEAWKLGLKAIALYRDGCKLSQPLSAKPEKKAEKNSDTQITEIQKIETPRVAATTPAQTTVSQTMAHAPVQRRRLPAKRNGLTIEAAVGGHQVYLRTGEYEDGSIGEVFIDMHKEGAEYSSMMNCFATSVSLGLQYGVPLKEFVDQFTFTRFEPAGTVTGHPNVKMATSVVDYMFRVLGMEYLGRTDFLQVKPSIEKSIEQSIEQSPEQSTPESNLMRDAPPCDSCGHTTVRNGACFRCLNCGTSLGCS